MAWVRSQNKMALMDATTFRMYYDGKKYWRIYCDQTCIAEEYTNLGSYSTKEKALKVLDMIQEHITNMYIGTNNYMGKPFQMPADEDV